MKRSALAVPAVLVIALLVAGCGGGSSSTAPSGGGTGGKEGGTPPKATAPNAPAGSKVASCGGSGTGTAQLRATVVDCDIARATMGKWEQSQACALGKGSRSSCSLDGFRCQAVKVDRGASVSCAGAKGDVSFIVRRGY